MTTKAKFLNPLALLSLLALLAVPAIAQETVPTVPGPHHGRAAMMQHVVAKLNLTAEQQTAVAQLHQDLKTQMAPIHQQQQQLRTQLKAALAAPTPDAAAVGQLTIQSHQLRAQMKPIMATFHQKFEALLTADQLATYKQMQANKSL